MSVGALVQCSAQLIFCSRSPRVGTPSPQSPRRNNDVFDVFLPFFVRCSLLPPHPQFCRTPTYSRQGESQRNAAYPEDSEKPAAERKNKLVRPIPTNIAGVMPVLKGEARSDILEIERRAAMLVSILHL